MTGKEQANLLGLFFWIFTGFQVFGIAIVTLIMIVYFGVIMTVIPHKADDPTPVLLGFGFIVVLAIILASFLLFSVPKIVAGYGLRKEKSWARIWAIVACCMAVLSFPLGTALGVWGLIFLFGDEGKRYFEGPEYGRLGAYPPYAVDPPEPSGWQ